MHDWIETISTAQKERSSQTFLHHFPCIERHEVPSLLLPMLVLMVSPTHCGSFHFLPHVLRRHTRPQRSTHLTLDTVRVRIEFLREQPRVTLVEAPTVYAEYTSLLYAINQIQPAQCVPWEWEVSADLFICGIAGKGRTGSTDQFRQAQRSGSSPRRFMHS
jgi:hypothetical protein